MAYPDGSDEQFANSYAPTWGRFRERTRPAVGNHEYRSGASGYSRYFGAAAGDSKKAYYSYDLGAWHIIVLNSACAAIGGCDAESPQTQRRVRHLPILVAKLVTNPTRKPARLENRRSTFLYRLYWFFFLSSWRSIPSWISRPIRSGYDMPEAAHSLGYMLMAVKPGMVLISLT
jgi:hypothetical protein